MIYVVFKSSLIDLETEVILSQPAIRGKILKSIIKFLFTDKNKESKELIEKEDLFFGSDYPCQCVQEICESQYLNGIHMHTGGKLTYSVVKGYFMCIPGPDHIDIDGIRICNRSNQPERSKREDSCDKCSQLHRFIIPCNIEYRYNCKRCGALNTIDKTVRDK